MTAARRTRLRTLVDQVRRERLCAGLGDDPTRVERCLGCGRPFRVAGSHSPGWRLCSKDCRVAWTSRQRTLTRIAEEAACPTS